jgi:hypothetical protein
VGSYATPSHFRSPSACDPMRRRKPALQPPVWRPDRTEVRRCPATCESRGPRTTGLRVGNGLVDAPDMPSFKEDVVAFRVAGVGIAFQDEHQSNEIHFNDYQVLRQLRNKCSARRSPHEMSSGSQFIRIVRTPPGEAPLWVREKWVGLELPLASNDYRPRHAYTSGVLSGPSNRLIALVRLLRGRLPYQSGYAVEAVTAVAILANVAPDAASWWRKNVPRSQRAGRKFMFHSSVCEIVNVATEAKSSHN